MLFYRKCASFNKESGRRGGRGCSEGCGVKQRPCTVANQSTPAFLLSHSFTGGKKEKVKASAGHRNVGVNSQQSHIWALRNETTSRWAFKFLELSSDNSVWAVLISTATYSASASASSYIWETEMCSGGKHTRKRNSEALKEGVTYSSRASNNIHLPPSLTQCICNTAQ